MSSTQTRLVELFQKVEGHLDASASNEDLLNYIVTATEQRISFEEQGPPKEATHKCCGGCNH